MSINPEDIKIELISIKQKEVMPAFNVQRFVKITHLESGVCVTKYSDISQHKAKESCLIELENLIKLWNW